METRINEHQYPIPTIYEVAKQDWLCRFLGNYVMHFIVNLQSYYGMFRFPQAQEIARFEKQRIDSVNRMIHEINAERQQQREITPNGSKDNKKHRFLKKNQVQPAEISGENNNKGVDLASESTDLIPYDDKERHSIIREKIRTRQLPEPQFAKGRLITRFLIAHSWYLTIKFAILAYTLWCYNKTLDSLQMERVENYNCSTSIMLGIHGLAISEQEERMATHKWGESFSMLPGMNNFVVILPKVGKYRLFSLLPTNITRAYYGMEVMDNSRKDYLFSPRSALVTFMARVASDSGNPFVMVGQEATLVFAYFAIGIFLMLALFPMELLSHHEAFVHFRFIFQDRSFFPSFIERIKLYCQRLKDMSSDGDGTVDGSKSMMTLAVKRMMATKLLRCHSISRMGQYVENQLIFINHPKSTIIEEEKGLDDDLDDEPEVSWEWPSKVPLIPEVMIILQTPVARELLVPPEVPVRSKALLAPETPIPALRYRGGGEGSEIMIDRGSYRGRYADLMRRHKDHSQQLIFNDLKSTIIEEDEGLDDDPELWWEWPPKAPVVPEVPHKPQAPLTLQTSVAPKILISPEVPVPPEAPLSALRYRGGALEGSEIMIDRGSNSGRYADLIQRLGENSQQPHEIETYGEFKKRSNANIEIANKNIERFIPYVRSETWFRNSIVTFTSLLIICFLDITTFVLIFLCSFWIQLGDLERNASCFGQLKSANRTESNWLSGSILPDGSSYLGGPDLSKSTLAELLMFFETWYAAFLIGLAGSFYASYFFIKIIELIIWAYEVDQQLDLSILLIEMSGLDFDSRPCSIRPGKSYYHEFRGKKGEISQSCHIRYSETILESLNRMIIHQCAQKEDDDLDQPPHRLVSSSSTSTSGNHNDNHHKHYYELDYDDEHLRIWQQIKGSFNHFGGIKSVIKHMKLHAMFASQRKRLIKFELMALTLLTKRQTVLRGTYMNMNLFLDGINDSHFILTTILKRTVIYSGLFCAAITFSQPHYKFNFGVETTYLAMCWVLLNLYLVGASIVSAKVIIQVE